MSATDQALVRLDHARSALAECRTVMEAKHIADVAEAARVYLERTNASTETVNRASEIRVLAERQMGEFLKIMPKNVGANGSKVTGSVKEPVRDDTPTLREVGITKKQSASAQKLANIPKPEFEGRIQDIKSTGGRISSASLLRSKRASTVNVTPKRDDSPKLASLKSTWRLTGQRDRKAFLLWIETQR